MPPSPTAARSRCSAARMVRNMTHRRRPRLPARARGRADRLQEGRATCPTTRSSTCRPGRQGEPMAVLARMANLDHQIEVGPGDTVILASSLIPGNENAVYRVIDGLTKLGANVVHKGNAKVHVSGHAAAGELLYCYNILKPKNVLPVHGEYRHLDRERRSSRIETGVPAEQHDHRRERHRHRPARTASRRVVGQLDLGFVYVDGSTRRRDHRRRPQGSPDPRRGGLHLDHRRGGRRDRARSSSAPRSTPAASPRTTRSSTTSSRRSPRRSPRPRRTGVRDTHALSQIVRRTVGRWVNTSATAVVR